MNNRLLIALLALFIWTGESSIAKPANVLPIEYQDGKDYLLHKVEPKETFYSIAKKYKCSVADLQAANKEVKELKVGMEIKVPVTKLKTTTSDSKAVSGEIKAPTTEAKKKNSQPRTTSETHKVKAGETLYGIAKQYNIPPAELKSINNLTDGTLTEGQVLKLTAPKTKAAFGVEKGGEEVIAPIKKEGENDKIDLGESGFERITEKGIAEVIDDQKNSKLHLALHKTAPVGTILKIKNEVNGFSVYVRVIGKLPETGENSKVIVKISRKAFLALEANSKEFPVEVSFSKP